MPLTTHPVTLETYFPSGAPMEGTWYLSVAASPDPVFLDTEGHQLFGGPEPYPTEDGVVELQLYATGQAGLLPADGRWILRFVSLDRSVIYGPYTFEVTGPMTLEDVADEPSGTPVTPTVLAEAQEARDEAEGFKEDAQTAAASVQREQASGVAGLTSGGKIYEARIPTRLSDASLATAFVAPRSEGRAARWVTRISDRTKPLLYDSFDRADSASSLGTAESGQAWTAGSGTWGISNRRGYLVTASGTEGCAVVDLGVPADWIQADLQYKASGTPDPGLLIRYVDSNNYIMAAFETGNFINIWTKVAGSYTNLGAVSVSGGLFGTGKLLYLRADYQRGVGKITVTLAGGNGILGTNVKTLNSTNRGIFELGTKVGLRSGTTDQASGYTSVLAGVK